MEKTQLWKGTLEGCILTEIGKHATYGYNIVETLRRNGFDGLTEGTVYPLLLRLEKQGYLQSELHDSPMGPKRKYYALTESGRESAKEFAEAWKQMALAVGQILESAPSGQNPAGDSLLARPGTGKKKRKGGFFPG